MTREEYEKELKYVVNGEQPVRNPDKLDCINRQVVLDMLEDINAETDGIGFYYEHYVDYIKSLPSTKPQEPKTVLYSGDGYADGYMVYDMAECPNCGREFEEGDETWNCNFCPDCGQALKWEEEQNG